MGSWPNHKDTADAAAGLISIRAHVAGGAIAGERTGVWPAME